MFRNKGVKIAKKPSMVEPKVLNPSIHIMDINIDINMVITKSKSTKSKSLNT
jgi:hypothetical protein